MGFSLRKKSPPDLTNAEVFYKAALALDPLHRGALEYYGELLLIRNDLTGAEALLNRLGKACPMDCEEYRDLKAGIASFKLRK
jgi:predicted Zn-dependent protease